MEQELISKLLDITRKAGEIIKESQQEGIQQLNPIGQSPITQADIAISEYAQQSLKPLIETGNHLLIDEEDKKNSLYFTDTFLNTPEYIWAIDPVDATRDLVMGTPFYAVTIGIFKNKKPYMGAVYFPAFGELYWNDGQKSFLVTLPFTDSEQHYQLNPVQIDLNGNQFMYTSAGFWKNYKTDIHPSRNFGAHCFHLMWMCKGWGKATIFKNKIWDFAGSWAVLKDSGLKLYNLETQEEITEISLNLFEGIERNPWGLNDFVLCITEQEKDHFFKRLKKI